MNLESNDADEFSSKNIMFNGHKVCPILSLTLFKIFASNDI